MLMGVSETGTGPAPQDRAALQHREGAAHSTHGNEDSCLEPGEARVQGGDLTFPCRPPCSVYSKGLNLMMWPCGLPPSPGEEPSTLSAGAVGKNWLCDLSQPLGIAWLGKLCVQSEESPEIGEIWAEQPRRRGAAAGGGTLLGGSATKL